MRFAPRVNFVLDAGREALGRARRRARSSVSFFARSRRVNSSLFFTAEPQESRGAFERCLSGFYLSMSLRMRWKGGKMPFRHKICRICFHVVDWAHPARRDQRRRAAQTRGGRGIGRPSREPSLLRNRARATMLHALRPSSHQRSARRIQRTASCLSRLLRPMRAVLDCL